MANEPVVAVCVTHRFSAAPERVFDAWLDPALLSRWMFGPLIRDEEVVQLTLDPRVSGRFSFVVRRDGANVEHVGVYLAIDRPRRLVFTWGIPVYAPGHDLVSVEVTSLATGCALTLNHELRPGRTHIAERAAASWASELRLLAATLTPRQPAN